ncbi:hypothetical protein F5B19DRAFT_60728 [Rostrohypoxylon terebratum]|nr:hypothetical protein F5B19DRAFT_60728 [Rostrohypoxylon terebratum]
MNGAKDATDPSVASSTEDTTSSPTTIPLMTGANGNGTNSTTGNLGSPTLLNKKRKKDGLKPIITTEGPVPGSGCIVLCCMLMCVAIYRSLASSLPTSTLQSRLALL